MKIIINKKTNVPGLTQKGKMTYFELITICVNKVNRQIGITIQEMNKKLRILKAIENAKDGKAEMEDADFEMLKSCVVNFKWGMVHKDIVDFYNYINQKNEKSN